MISSLALLATLSCLLSRPKATVVAQKVEQERNLRGDAQISVEEAQFNRTLKSPVRFEIVGGDAVSLGEYPYYVDMNNGCGGSLIAPDIVLSAAHCGNYLNDNIIVGALYPGVDTTTGATKVKVVKWARHPSYNRWTLRNDFAIMKISPAVTLPSNVVLSINEKRAIPEDGKDLSVIGLGLQTNNANDDGASILQDVTVQAIPNRVCNRRTWYQNEVDETTMFCAGFSEGGKDSCQGDSGGPIVRKVGDSHVQVGLVSWGDGCAQRRRPGVYARVSSAYDWIKDVSCNRWGSTAPFCGAPTATAGNDSGSSGNSNCPAGKIEFDFTVKTDGNGRQTGWRLIDTSKRRVVDSQRRLQNNQTYRNVKCLDASNYRLVIRDRRGNGICCGGGYSLKIDGKLIKEDFSGTAFRRKIIKFSR